MSDVGLIRVSTRLQAKRCIPAAPGTLTPTLATTATSAPEELVATQEVATKTAAKKTAAKKTVVQKTVAQKKVTQKTVAQKPTASKLTTKKPIAKRQKVSPAAPSEYKNVRGRRGGLKILYDMPVDVFLEIFGHLDPVDLLNISRASKELRALTQGPGSKVLWEQVYFNLGENRPPIRLPGLNLRYLTVFLYGKYCQICASPKAQFLQYTSLARLCFGCALKNVVPFAKVGKPFSQICIPTIGIEGHTFFWRTCYYKVEIDFHKKMLGVIGSAERLAYLQTLAKDVPAREQYFNALRIWSDKESLRRERADNEARRSRENQFVSHIEAAGYEVDLQKINLRRIPGVNGTAILTEKSWDRIKFRVLGVFEHIRQENIRRTMETFFHTRNRMFRELWNAAFETVCKPRIMAPFCDIIHWEPIHSILMTYSGPDMDHFPEDMRNLLMPNLVERIIEISNTWKKNADRKLLDLLDLNTAKASAEKGEAAPDTTPLELATTFFSCHWCAEALSYPRVLEHYCLCSSRPTSSKESLGDEPDVICNDEDGVDEQDNLEKADQDSDGYKIDETYGIERATPKSAWTHMYDGIRWNESGEEITFDEEASGAAKAILLDVGEDPTSITAAKIQAMDIRVECMRCAGVKKGRSLVMTWNMAIYHDMEVHSGDSRPPQSWRLVTDEDKLAQITRKEGARKPALGCIGYDRQCLFCHSKETRASIQRHIESHEGLDGPWMAYSSKLFDAPMKEQPLFI